MKPLIGESLRGQMLLPWIVTYPVWGMLVVMLVREATPSLSRLAASLAVFALAMWSLRMRRLMPLTSPLELFFAPIAYFAAGAMVAALTGWLAQCVYLGKCA